MANNHQLETIRLGSHAWNEWRRDRWDPIDLSGADLSNLDLADIELSEANLSFAKLKNTNLHNATLDHANFRGADLESANLTFALLLGADFSEANLQHADLTAARAPDAIFERANLSKSTISNVLGTSDMPDFSFTNFQGANLSEAILGLVNFYCVDFSYADLTSIQFSGCILNKATLNNANLIDVDFFATELSEADLSGLDLRKTSLVKANLTNANLSNADLRGSNLSGANLLGANVENAKLSGNLIYGINIWDIVGEFAIQKDLIITKENDPVITVDNIKIAQFIYLILTNQEIRNVINELSSKAVLILGRFSVPGRKEILDSLKNKLRDSNLLPIVFDFDRPVDRDITETIKLLASLSYFVIADITNPKSSPLELQATVPDFKIPFLPIIQEGEEPFSMLADLQNKYKWVLATLSYDSKEALIDKLKPAIIDRAIQMHNDLRLEKASTSRIQSLKDFSK